MRFFSLEHNMDLSYDGRNEKVHLLRAEPCTSNASCAWKKSLNLKDAFYIMLGFNLGANVLVMPFTITQLGLATWLICLTAIILLETVAAYLLWKSTLRIIIENQDIDVSRDAFPAITKFSCGRIGKILAVVGLFVSAWSICISFLLLAASTVADLVPIPNVSHQNVIRIWTAVITAIVTPIMYLGNYSDVKIPSVIALSTSVMTIVGIIINCAIYKLEFPSARIEPEEHPMRQQHFLVSMGTLLFATNATTIVIPNVTPLATRPQQLWRSILTTNTCLYFLLLIIGLIPYMVFGENNMPSTVSTFYLIMHKIGDRGTVLKVITVMMQVLMLGHLTMGSVLAMNPSHLYLEEFLRIEHGFNFKRVLIRTTCMAIILSISLVVPQFEFAIGIAGGVPLTFMSIFLPLLIFTRLFHNSPVVKGMVYLFLTGVVVFIFGNLVYSIIDINKG